MWTVGHSTRTLDELLALVRAHGVTLIADVRKIPRSRRHPQFNREALARDLPAAGVGYVHLPALGGLRRGHAHSVNTAWKNPSFRAYADYMQTDEFAAALEGLAQHAREAETAIMCAEAVWWRCHRSLIADALVARAIPVRHIVSAERAEPHALRSFAVLDGTRVSYPGPPELFGTTTTG